MGRWGRFQTGGVRIDAGRERFAVGFPQRKYTYSTRPSDRLYPATGCTHVHTAPCCVELIDIVRPAFSSRAVNSHPLNTSQAPSCLGRVPDLKLRCGNAAKLKNAPVLLLRQQELRKFVIAYLPQGLPSPSIGLPCTHERSPDASFSGR
jgi:hypothetical protein